MNNLKLPQLPRRALSTMGFSLIEVLISMLVLSLGIIGAVKMQLHSIQTSQQSNFYSTAMELASDIADKMRSNNDQVRLANSNPFLAVDFQSGKNQPTSSGNCFAINCSPSQLAKADIAEWIQHVFTALPNARAVICRDNSSWNSSSNSLTWDCGSSDDKTSIVIKLGWIEKNETSPNPPPRLALAVTPSY